LEILKTAGAVKKRVKCGGVLKVEKGYAISVFNKTSESFDELEARGWTDVTSHYQ
jgi:hypothetical protein